MLAVVVGVTLAAGTSCSSSAPGAQAPLPVAPSHPTPTPTPAASAPVSSSSAEPTKATSSPSAALQSPVALVPPKTPETVAGAEQVTRAYFAALNEVEARADLVGARLLPAYVLPTCQLCVQFNSNLMDDAVRARRIHGRAVGGQFAISGLGVAIDPAIPQQASGSIRYSVSADQLLDSRGVVVGAGPAGPPTTYMLFLSYVAGHWRLSNVTSAP